MGPRVDDDSGVGRHATIGHCALPGLELGVDFRVGSRVLGGSKADEGSGEGECANHACGVSGEGKGLAGEDEEGFHRRKMIRFLYLAGGEALCLDNLA